MSSPGGYLFTVACAAILASIVKSLTGGDAMGTLVKYLCSLFLVLTVVSPLVKLELPAPGEWLAEFRYEGRSAVEAGEAMAAEASGALIKEKLEAYILDKAAAWNTAPEVQVSLDESGMPMRIVLRGQIPAAVKAALKQMVCNDLGLNEEAVEWAE